MALKTGLMLGLGETTEELLDTLAELREAGCRMLTLGQYLQPSPAQLPVVRYLPPDEFEQLGQLARQIGFEHVASGPFVRSSYHAGRMLDGGSLMFALERILIRRIGASGTHPTRLTNSQLEPLKFVLVRQGRTLRA